MLKYIEKYDKLFQLYIELANLSMDTILFIVNDKNSKLSETTNSKINNFVNSLKSIAIKSKDINKL